MSDTSDPSGPSEGSPTASDPAGPEAVGPAGWPEPEWMTRARSGASLAPGALPRGYSTTATPTSRDLPVYVDLAVTFPRPPGAEPGAAWTPDQKEASDIGTGVSRRGRLVCAGEVRGLLHHWERRVEGDWIAIVSYKVPLAGDPRPSVLLNRVAVPEHAVRPAE